MNIKKIDWESAFKRQPDRYLKVYNESHTLIEVHDRDTGNIWFNLGDNRWSMIL